MPNAKLIVGLGNPGKKYRMTRHNIGFMVIDALAERLKISLKQMDRLDGICGKGGDVALLKPQTFMNLSGQSVQKTCAFYKVEDLLVICDDAALDFGRLRMREEGGAGGHNGLRDIIAVLGSKFQRLKLGIGDPGDWDLADYVLANFNEHEQAKLPTLVGEAVDVCETWLLSGFQRAAEKAALWEG